MDGVVLERNLGEKDHSGLQMAIAADEEIFTTPPFLCIEILSPEDRAVAAGMLAVSELRTENPGIDVPLAELFED